jgi:hypothetical protein
MKRRMARSSHHQQREAERRYPVRVLIAVPPEGLGQQLALMHAWLDDTCGAEGWAAAPAGSVGVVNGAIAFYFCRCSFRSRLCRPVLLRLSGRDDRRRLRRAGRRAAAPPSRRHPQDAVKGCRCGAAPHSLIDAPRLGSDCVWRCRAPRSAMDGAAATGVGCLRLLRRAAGRDE